MSRLRKRAGDSGSNRACEAGWLALPLLAWMTIVLSLGAWIATEAIVRERSRRAHERDRVLDSAFQYAIHFGSNQLRLRFRSRSHPQPSEVFRSWSLPAFETESGQAVGVRLLVSPSARPWMRTTLVKGTAPERSELRWVSVLALTEATPQTLDRCLDEHRTELETEGQAEAIRQALIEWRTDPTEVPSWDSLERVLVERAGQTPAAASRWRLRLDGTPRLRRTLIHPSRIRGRDRGRVASTGTILELGYRGRFQLRVELTWPGSFRETIRRSTEIQLWHEERLSSQEDWFRPRDVQVGGVSSVGVFVGPENRAGGVWNWSVGTSPILSSSEGVGESDDVGEDRWLPLMSRGALQIEKSPRGRVRVHSPDLRRPTEIAGNDCARITGGFLVSSSGQLRSFDDLGNSREGPISFSTPDRELSLFELPLLDRVLISDAEDWFLVDGALNIDSSGRWAEDLGPEHRVLRADRAAGVWGVDRRGRRWFHADWMGSDGWRLRYSPLGSSGPGSIGPGSIERNRKASAIPALRQWVVVEGESLLHFWSLSDRSITRTRGESLALPQDSRVVGFDPTGLGVWFRVVTGELDYRGLHYDRDDHSHWGLQGVRSLPRVVADGIGSASGVLAFARDDLAAMSPVGRLQAGGSVDGEGSTLDGADLCDLTGRGLISTPQRGEVWRIDGESSCGRDQGAATVTLEPANSGTPSTASDPEVVVGRLTHRARVSFSPSSSWLVANHPALISAERLSRFTVEGEVGSRTWRRRIELVRRRDVSSWEVRASYDISGIAWRVRAWLRPTQPGDAEVALAPWVVADALLLPDSQMVQVDDTSPPGEPVSLQWRWLSTGELDLTTENDSTMESGRSTGRVSGTNGGLDVGLSRSSPAAAGLRFESSAWAAEWGGPLGDRTYHGLIRDFVMADDPTSLLVRTVAMSSKIRWVSDRLYPIGSRIRQCRLLGEQLSSPSIRWQLQVVGATGRKTRRGTGTIPTYPLDSLREPSRVVVDFEFPVEAGGFLIEGLSLQVETPLDRVDRDGWGFVRSGGDRP